MQRIQVAAGASVEVRSAGAGEPLLLIQTALDPEALVPLALEPPIAERFRVIDSRRRGYCSSSPADGPGSIAGDAADALVVVRALDCHQVHVLGTSYSGAVALELAAMAPELVSTLTLIEPPPRHGPPADEFVAAHARLRQVFEDAGVTEALEEFTQVLGAPSWLAERALADPELIGRVERDATTFFAADVPALMDWHFASAQAAGVRCPVLYIGGRDSPAWFTHVHSWVTELFPECEHHLIASAGHSVATTHSPEVAGLLNGFIDRHRIPHRFG